MTGRTAAVVAVSLLGGAAPAAPPAVTHLYPGGAQRGTTAEITVGGTFDRWPVQVWTSDKSVTAKAGKDKGKVAVAVAADAIPGVHWLRFHDDQGVSSPRPFVVGLLKDVAEKEPNDDSARAQAVEATVVVNGRLDRNGDVDAFALKLARGQTLVASVDAHRSVRSPMDGVLQVVTPDGFVLAQNNDWHGLDPQVVFPVPKDGPYLVRVFGFPAVPDAGIRLSGGEAFVYRLTLTTGGFADHPWPLAVERKPDAAVTVTGWNVPAEARTLPVPTTDDVATVFHPALANPLRVRVEGHRCWTTLDDRPGPHQPPFSVTGRLAKPGDRNVCSVTGRKGQPLLVRVESRDLGLPVNPVLRVLDAAGKPAARAEPARINTDVELTFTPPADGTYTVDVSDLYGDGGPRFVYRLRVTPPEPDFDLTVPTDRFALAPGKPLDIPVTVTRRGGFARDVEVAAEGLPSGVVAVVAPATGKEPKAVTLRLTADKVGPSGSFRIVGKVKDRPDRVARAPLPEFDATIGDLWLAVGGQVAPPPPKKKR